MPRGSGWGRGSPFLVGSGYCVRENCDGQTLASPERWPVESRRCPEHPEWKRVADMITDFFQTFGTMEPLVNQAMGRIKDSPFQPEACALKHRTIRELEELGLPFRRHEEDMPDPPVDFHFYGSADEGRAGPRSEHRKIRERSSTITCTVQARNGHDKGTPMITWKNVMIPKQCGDRTTQRSMSWPRRLEDPVKFGQVVMLSEEDDILDSWSLLLVRTERRRVLHDGSNGMAVSRRTRVRDQKRCPMASDLKRSMREKAKRGETTFALTTDVKEAHRQIPVAREGRLAVARMPCPAQYLRLHKHGRHIRNILSFVLQVGDWQIDAVRRRPVCHNLGYVGGSRLSFGDEWRGVSDWSYHFLCRLLASQSPALVGEDVWWRHPHMCWVSNCSTSLVDWVSLNAGRWETEKAETINTSSFKEGLGRVTYLAGALEHDRASLYQFVALHPRGSVRRVPSYVRFILKYLASEVAKCRIFDCALELRDNMSAIQVI